MRLAAWCTGLPHCLGIKAVYAECFHRDKAVKISKCFGYNTVSQRILSGAADRAPLSFHPGTFYMFNKTRFSWNYSTHISKLFQKKKCKLGRIQYLKFYFNYLFLYSSFIQIFGKSGNQNMLENNGENCQRNHLKRNKAYYRIYTPSRSELIPVNL